jgi:hypothetical protein
MHVDDSGTKGLDWTGPVAEDTSASEAHEGARAFDDSFQTFDSPGLARKKGLGSD